MLVFVTNINVFEKDKSSLQLVTYILDDAQCYFKNLCEPSQEGILFDNPQVQS
jgi:hypothetical protein